MHKYWFWMDGNKVGDHESEHALSDREMENIERAYNKHNSIVGVRLIKTQTKWDFKVNYL